MGFALPIVFAAQMANAWIELQAAAVLYPLVLFNAMQTKESEK